MTNRPALFCAHANAGGDASRCACTVLGPDASREEILAFEGRRFLTRFAPCVCGRPPR